MHNSDKHHLIDNFFSNQLSQTEKLRFNKLIEEDPNFWNEVKEEQYTDNNIFLGVILHVDFIFDTPETPKLHLRHPARNFGVFQALWSARRSINIPARALQHV